MNPKIVLSRGNNLLLPKRERERGRQRQRDRETQRDRDMHFNSKLVLLTLRSLSLTFAPVIIAWDFVIVVVAHVLTCFVVKCMNRSGSGDLWWSKRR